MIIEELIQQLQSYQKKSRVIVQGYEDGYDEITTIKKISIQPNPSHEWYNGKYMSSDNVTSETAILIFSTDRLRESDASE